MEGEIDWEGIECTKCGNCCTADPVVGCGEFDRETRLCRAHPEVVGEEEANRRRGNGCKRTTPTVAASHGYYCEPVVEHIQGCLGRRVESWVPPWGKGSVEMENWKEVLGDLRAKGMHWCQQRKVVGR